MPFVQANTGAKILVTGANGYVAMAVIQELLKQGFTVRGAVRSQSKGEQVQKIFSSYSGDKFESVIVEDITQEGAFDEAVKDIDAIVHTASPLPSHSSDEDPQVYIKPALQGTLSILNSVSKHGSQVKRIVLTSSIASIMPPLNGPTVLDEKNWGDEYIKIVDRQGKNASVVEKYIASKTLAEHAAWDFHAKHKKEGGWDLVVFNPSNILGPLLQDFKSLDEVTRSVQYWYEFMSMEQPEENLKSTVAYVDIRDVAAAHVEALKKEAAAGHRIILSAGSVTWQDARNSLLALKPQYFSTGVLKRGNPDLKTEVMFTLNSQKTQNILGIEYKSYEETVLDTLAEFEKRGFFA